MILLKIVLVFIIGVTIDILSVMYSYYVIASRPLPVAFIGTAITTCVLFGILNIVNSTLLMIPYLLGVFLGGFLGIKLKQKLERLNE
jgi:uncharacterized membrane protein YfcA